MTAVAVPMPIENSVSPLSWSREILEEIFRHSETGFLMMDLHGFILEVNQAVCRLTGRDRETLLGTSILGLLDREDADATTELLASLGERKRKSYSVLRHYRSSPSRSTPVRVSGSVVASGGQELVCAIELLEDVEDEVETQQKLLQSEAQYRSIVDEQTELLVRWTPDGTRTFVNASYCADARRPEEELLGASLFASIPAEDARTIAENLSRLTPDLPATTYRHRSVGPDGALRWQEWTDHGWFDDAGTLVEIQSVGRDVTDEQLAAAALEESELRYRNLFHELPVAVWESNWGGLVEALRAELPDGGGPQALQRLARERSEDHGWMLALTELIEANPAALTLFHATSETGVREAAAKALAADPDRLAAAIGPLLLGIRPVAEAEFVIEQPDGTKTDAVFRWVRSGDSDDWRVLTTVIDVTEERRLERALEHERRLLESAEEIAGLGSWAVDRDRTTIYGSAEFWRILDGMESIPQTRPASAFLTRVHPDDFQDVQRASGRESRQGQLFEFRILQRDGSVRVVQTRGFRALSPDGELVGTYGVLRDVTDEKLAAEKEEMQRQELLRADKMISLGVLVSGVAHEINNTTHSILLNAPILGGIWRDLVPWVDRRAANESGLRVGGLPWVEMRGEGQQVIAEILKGAERIRAIAAELRDFARDAPTSGRMRVALNPVVESSLRLLRNRLRKATVRFRSELAGDLRDVEGNAQRLEQIVINLLMNACDALTSTQQAIEVTTVADPGRQVAVLRVRDEGRGIPADRLERIFDPFYTTKRAEGGMGLGLAVSSRIAAEHGGRLRFESVVGSGTVAVLEIPFAEDAS